MLWSATFCLFNYFFLTRSKWSKSGCMDEDNPFKNGCYKILNLTTCYSQKNMYLLLWICILIYLNAFVQDLGTNSSHVTPTHHPQKNFIDISTISRLFLAITSQCNGRLSCRLLRLLDVIMAQPQPFLEMAGSQMEGRVKPDIGVLCTNLCQPLCCISGGLKSCLLAGKDFPQIIKCFDVNCEVWFAVYDT